MAARRFVVHHKGTEFPIDYDTDDSLELTDGDRDPLVTDESDLVASEDTKEFEQRIRPYVNGVLLYEDPVRQEAALKSVPVAEIQEKALVSLAKEGNFKPSKDEEDHSFLLQLLLLFKQSFRPLFSFTG